MMQVGDGDEKCDDCKQHKYSVGPRQLPGQPWLCDGCAEKRRKS